MVLTPSAMAPLGSKAPDFALPDTEGNVVRRSDFHGQPLLVVFLCNHCPYVKHIADTLAEVTDAFMERGVAVVGINSNDVDNYPDDSPEKMVEEKALRGYAFPYLFDGAQDVAHAFDAQCTPDFFLYDSRHQLYYRGQFDSARPGNDEPVTGHDLVAAVEALLEGREVPEQVPSVGCNIKWKA
jgi:peroxiredoxin